MNLVELYNEIPIKKYQHISEIISLIYYIEVREAAPIYTLGTPDPRSTSRGNRGIAGTIIFKSHLSKDKWNYIESLKTIQGYSHNQRDGSEGMRKFTELRLLNSVGINQLSYTFIAKKVEDIR